MYRKLFVIFFAVIGMSACDRHEEVGAETCALDFCEAFFNFRYADALKLCDDGQDGWLRIYLSNLCEADQDSVRLISERPSFDVDNVTCQGDSVATAVVNVHSVYYLEAIGKPGRLVKDGRYRLFLSKNGGAWKIRRGDLLQSGR